MVQKIQINFIKKKKITETNLAVSVAAGIGSGLIKVPGRFSISCSRGYMMQQR